MVLILRTFYCSSPSQVSKKGVSSHPSLQRYTLRHGDDRFRGKGRNDFLPSRPPGVFVEISCCGAPVAQLSRPPGYLDLLAAMATAGEGAATSGFRSVSTLPRIDTAEGCSA